MKYEETEWYSSRCQANLKVKIYGHYGISVIAFPCQDKQSDDFSNNGMIDVLSPYIESGRIKLFCIDSIDYKSVSIHDWDKEKAIYFLEQYYQYVINELLPFVYFKNNGKCYPYLIGCSMGASHAAITFFRSPQLFSGLICLSGDYDMSKYFDGYINETLYYNSPVHFIPYLADDHPDRLALNNKHMIFCVGSGSWEHLVIDSNRRFKEILKNKNISAWYDIWGTDYPHDWSSWKIQLPYYLDKIL